MDANNANRPTPSGGGQIMGAIPRKRLPPPAPIVDVPPSVRRMSTTNITRQDEGQSYPKIPRRSLPPTNHPFNRGLTTTDSSFMRAGSATHEEEGEKKSSNTIEMPKTITWVSESPLILRIRTKNIPMTEGLLKITTTLPAEQKRPPVEQGNDDEWSPHKSRMLRGGTARSSAQKRPRSVYLEDTDSEMDDDVFLPPKKTKSSLNAVTTEISTETSRLVASTDGMDPNAIDAPPPGTISTLWYSREAFLHVFVLEKICGWKTRPKVQLIDTSTQEPILIDHVRANALASKALESESIWTDQRKRMELSRINSTHCPVVLALAAATSAGAWQCNVLEDREEVLLVKWRGRSHMHCSWERAADLHRLDTSNNSTARNKIRRYYQQQETTIGPNWKNVVEEERATAAKIHAHGGDEQEDDEVREDYFAPDYLEIERIVACDESEMNMQVLARQRSLNMQSDQISSRAQDSNWSALQSTSSKMMNFYAHLIEDVAMEQNDVKENPWDPEDNVRYVVKWKGLPFSEMTWEYWRDIKRDAVDEAEDFWRRQEPPSDIAQLPHPHIRDFRKLQESRVYGIPMFRVDGDEEEEGRGFRLRSYQLEGVNWLLFNWWNQRSCILADEMGLGKTIQSATFLRELQLQSLTRVRGPFLVVAPLSLVGQWQSELLTWAPDLNVVLYHGSADAREFLVEHEFYYTDQFVPKPISAKLKRLHVTKFHVLITTYEVILKDVNVFSRIRWKTLIVDEAHRLKNPKSRLFEQLATVPRDFCVLLTGTPIANATEELWALLHFANPDAFSDREGFMEKFGEMTDAKQVDELHSLLKPYLLRRVKEDVEKSLPPKEETILEVTLTPIQKTFYKAIYERNTAFLYKGAKPSNAPSLMNVMMELRKCCNHPYLVKGAEERILADAAAKVNGRNGNNEPVSIDYTKLFAEQLIKSSGKMVLMEKLLQKLFTGGHKVLVFSQMVRVLDLLEELMKLKNYKYERLDGSTSSSLRAHAVDRFNRKSAQRFIMLLSTRAGGLGLNLTAADTVIIFDSDWNPQNDLQAMARAHRIGQTRAVRVYRLLTAKTYEMHMFHSASLKLGLERAVLSQNRDHGDDSDDGGNSKSKKKSDKEAQAKEIDELLKKGAYDVFRDDDDAEAEKFMDTDIDHLLEHKSKKVTYGESSSASLGSGLGSFSKASFVAKTDDGAKDVDLDDPEFWAKAVGLETPKETSEEILQMIDDGVKRSRKQVQVYDPYAETAEAEQRKKERIALEKLLEKEEKERLRLEKKLKKEEEKEKRKRERDEQKTQLAAVKQTPAKTEKTVDKEATMVVGKEQSDPKTVKKSKKNERILALRRAENSDPILERLKQAWEVPHRNRASAATLRFGFYRFCKLRSESNLTGIPLQDLEIFVRSYVYQLGLQVAVSLLAHSKAGKFKAYHALIREWLGRSCSSQEVKWICDAAQQAMTMHLAVENNRRSLRLPVILAEPPFVEELRNGAALRALRRISLLGRLTRFVDDCMDSILTALGHEALGKRGCTSPDLSSLDPDLKSRFVTTEELSLLVGSFLRKRLVRAPASWWDRSCDVGLVVGSFVHGLSNYEAMRIDPDLPFAEKILRFSQRNKVCAFANANFRVAADAVQEVFTDALDAARVKAELEVQAAVAAAAKAALKREKDAALVRKGGAQAEAVISSMPQTQVQDAFAFDGTDSHFVTLPRLHTYIQNAVRNGTVDEMSESFKESIIPVPAKSDGDLQDHEDLVKDPEHELLPLPDARILDNRLLCVMREIETVAYGAETDDDPRDDETVVWEKSDEVQVNSAVRSRAISLFYDDCGDMDNEYLGIGLGSNQCGTSHKSLNDGSDYGYGPGSPILAPIAYGTDAPRYLRALGVPMNISRYAIAGLAYADPMCVKNLLVSESLKFFGKEDATGVSRVELVNESTRRLNDDQTSLTKEHVGDGGSSYQEKQKPKLVVNPLDRMPVVFRDSVKLRANICTLILFYGFPLELQTQTAVDSVMWKSLLESAGVQSKASPPLIFNLSHFRRLLVEAVPDCDLPDDQALVDYVERFFLPHCLRLCINGNGSTTRNARGSHGIYETALGVSVLPEPSNLQPSPLPDPCLSLQEHSLEALGYAFAILRRVRLLRSCMFIIAGKHISSSKLREISQSEFMGDLDGMPIWWCPWIHDVALMVEASTGGLFSVLRNRNGHHIFSREAFRDYAYSMYIANEKVPASRTSPEDVRAWVDAQTRSFPTLNQLELRLASLCAKATAELTDHNRFDIIPMFDHGGWPRK